MYSKALTSTQESKPQLAPHPGPHLTAGEEGFEHKGASPPGLLGLL